MHTDNEKIERALRLNKALTKAADDLRAIRREIRAAEEEGIKTEEMHNAVMKLCDMIDEADAKAVILAIEQWKLVEKYRGHNN